MVSMPQADRSLTPIDIAGCLPCITGTHSSAESTESSKVKDIAHGHSAGSLGQDL